MYCVSFRLKSCKIVALKIYTTIVEEASRLVSVSIWWKSRCEGKWGNLTVKISTIEIRHGQPGNAIRVYSLSTYNGNTCKFFGLSRRMLGNIIVRDRVLLRCTLLPTIMLDTNFKKLYSASHSLGTSYFPDKNSCLSPSPVNIKEESQTSHWRVSEKPSRRNYHFNVWLTRIARRQLARRVRVEL